MTDYKMPPNIKCKLTKSDKFDYEICQLMIENGVIELGEPSIEMVSCEVVKPPQ
jgi:hypothetical protein